MAGELFLSRGYAGASLGMIVAQSGGSFRDLHRTFGGKGSLFLRVMTDVCEEMLVTMGNTILRVLLSPRVLCPHRLVISESPRFPTLGKLFFQMGPSNPNKTVAVFLGSRADRKRLVLPDPCVAAAIFVNSLVNDLQLQVLAGGTVANSEMEDRVREAVRLFLSGVRQASLPSI